MAIGTPEIAAGKEDFARDASFPVNESISDKAFYRRQHRIFTSIESVFASSIFTFRASFYNFIPASYLYFSLFTSDF